MLCVSRINKGGKLQEYLKYQEFRTTAAYHPKSKKKCLWINTTFFTLIFSEHSTIRFSIIQFSTVTDHKIYNRELNLFFATNRELNQDTEFLNFIYTLSTTWVESNLSHKRSVPQSAATDISQTSTRKGLYIFRSDSQHGTHGFRSHNSRKGSKFRCLDRIQ